MEIIAEGAPGTQVRFAVAYADPPWDWESRTFAGEGRSAKRHYATMSVEAIAALPVGRHSAKPAEARHRIERLCGRGAPKLELFAREQPPGWHVFGNEIGLKGGPVDRDFVVDLPGHRSQVVPADPRFHARQTLRVR